MKKKFDLLLKIATHIQGKTHFRDIFRDILKDLQEIINFSNATIFLYSEERQKLLEFVRIGDKVDFISNITFPLGKGLAAWLGEQKKQLFLPSFRINKTEGMHSFILTPMIIQGNLRGMINIAHYEHNFFKKEDADFMQLVAGQMAGAMEWLFSMRALKKSNIELKKLLKKLQETQNKLIESEKKSLLAEIIVSLNHEINNPLAVIIGRIGLLKYFTTDEKMIESLDIIEKNGMIIAEILKKLQNLEKIESTEYVNGIKMLELNIKNEDKNEIL